VLPAFRICRNFPWSLIFAPKEVFGPGLRHLYTVQEIERIKDMILHTFWVSMTGQLYVSSFKLLHLDFGSLSPSIEWKYNAFEGLTTISLVGSS
jgi:hypothetical protein